MQQQCWTNLYLDSCSIAARRGTQTQHTKLAFPGAHELYCSHNVLLARSTMALVHYDARYPLEGANACTAWLWLKMLIHGPGIARHHQQFLILLDKGSFLAQAKEGRGNS